jgi:hypothetical protein
MSSRSVSIGLLACVAMLILPVAAWAAPANDNFANAKVVSGSGLREGVPGTTKAATKEAGEPEHAGDPGGASVWYSWTPLKNEVAAITTCGGFDTLLGVYTGTSVSSLTTVASNDDAGAFSGPGCGAPRSEIRLAVTAGTKYMIAVDGKGGASGSVLMRIYQPPSNDNFASATSIPESIKITPSNWLATKELGEPEHAGNPGGASVWYFWTAPESGSVELDTCGAESDTLLAVYLGTELPSLSPVVSNDNGPGECAPGSAVSFEAVASTTYKIAVDGAGGAEGWFNIHLTP